ncbi:hypothetical protein OHD16_09415 [Sphingobacterium sp. ML3W]|uniref:hypothetical protein n=1 Tax=Sphingobacterium sp. ML3W TaxID=1538644 RepID=UPI002499D749|nr:hypothetical protein [Sphingobacterium sp. ML3W]WFA80174.1 hypothetical protein OGI71_02555 [Sphingobacterium sp. ML3W]
MRATFILLFLFIRAFTYAQTKPLATNLSYPDLIPVLVNDSLYGYCDSLLDLKLPAIYESAGLFEEDFNFQTFHVNKPEIVKYGSAEYAWVQRHGERYRIDKNGEPVYKYDVADFKTGETLIQLFKNSTSHTINKVDDTTLFQQIKNNQTGQIAFPDDQSMADFKEKNKMFIDEGIRLIYYPKFTEIPCTYFSNEQTLLQGIKNKETGEILIKAKYASIEEYYNNPLRVHQYPLFIAYRGDLNKYIYVGLNGTEYLLYSAEIE